MRKTAFLFLTAILIGGLIFRLYRFNNPIADWHSWRQVDTSAVSRNFVKNGVDIFHPTFDDVSNVPSGMDNPKGFRFVEFPIYNFFQAEFFLIFKTLTLEQAGRLVTIISSLVSIFFIYGIVKKRSGVKVGLLSAFFFAFLPYNIYYDRTILPDPSMVAAILGGTYFFDLAIEKKHKIFFVLSLLFTTTAFLLKPYALFFVLPFVAIAYETYGLSFIKKWQLWLFLIVSILPLVWWRIWMTRFPEGIPVSNWLFNGGNIRFKGAFFYWLFADRFARLILGYWGISLFIFGLLKKYSFKIGLFYYSFLVSSLLYLFVIARGNVQHDYYQILIIPTISIFLALGSDFLLTSQQLISNKGRFLVFGLIIICMISFGWFSVRDYFNINNSAMVNVGKTIDKIIPQNAKVIAPFDGDTTFLYQINRKGWASFEKPLPEMIKMGADYLVLLNPNPKDFTGFGSMYKVISSTDTYILFDLHHTP